MSTETSHPKIAIIGAGPAGLTLARILQRNDIAVTIFELESGSENRDQGGSLDLHPKTGQAALQAAGLMNEFRKFARPEGDCRKVLRYDGTILFDNNVQVTTDTQSNLKGKNGTIEKGSNEIMEGRPEIDRGRLRAILLDSIKPGTIQWTKKLVKIEPGAENSQKHNLHFSDGVIETDFDLIIGADGAWSKVRPLLTDTKPFYSGITGIELWALNVEEDHPWLSNYVGNGTLFLFDEDRALICQRNGSVGVPDSIRVLVCVRKPENWLDECGIDWKRPHEARERLVEECFGNCGGDVKRAITDAGDKMWMRKLSMLPVGLEWQGKAGLTLLGDAAHLMTPFAGVGVNVAMADAKDLGEKIVVRSKGDRGVVGLDVVVREYEKEMFVRAEENAVKTADGLRGHFSSNGADELAERLRGHA